MYESHESLISALNIPLAEAIKSLNANYWLTAECEDDEWVIFEFEGDGPKIEVRVQIKYKYECKDCGERFNEPLEEEIYNGRFAPTIEKKCPKCTCKID
jgi:hypothetical protein